MLTCRTVCSLIIILIWYHQLCLDSQNELWCAFHVYILIFFYSLDACTVFFFLIWYSVFFSLWDIYMFSKKGMVWHFGKCEKTSLLSCHMVLSDVIIMIFFSLEDKIRRGDTRKGVVSSTLSRRRWLWPLWRRCCRSASTCVPQETRSSSL